MAKTAGCTHLSAPRFNVLLHRLTDSLRLVAVKEGHLQSVVFVEEAVHGREDHRHAEFIGVDEVQGLGHRDEDLFIDALGHPILAHEVQHAELVLLVDEVLAAHQHRQERRRSLELLLQRQHLLVHQDGQAKVEGRRNARNEVKGRELSRQLLHREDHLVHLHARMRWQVSAEPRLQAEQRIRAARSGISPSTAVYRGGPAPQRGS
eukprot:scaffold357_cov239-Pinguiococcus_pyrenoidosus.AAC.5